MKAKPVSSPGLVVMAFLIMIPRVIACCFIPRRLRYSAPARQQSRSLCPGPRVASLKMTVSDSPGLAPAALVTGSTDGIGLTTARELATNHGYHVLIHGRNAQRIARAVAAISKNVWALPPADLSTVQGSRDVAAHTIRMCQEKNLSLDILVNNAGVFSEKLKRTPDLGLEQTFAVNVLAPFCYYILSIATITQAEK
jgi:short chain dehydrogenase